MQGGGRARCRQLPGTMQPRPSASKMCSGLVILLGFCLCVTPCLADRLLVFTAPLVVPKKDGTLARLSHVWLTSNTTATYLCSYPKYRMPTRGPDYLGVTPISDTGPTILDEVIPAQYQMAFSGDDASMTWQLQLYDPATEKVYVQTCVDVSQPIFSAAGPPGTRILYPGVMANSFGAKALCYYAYGGMLADSGSLKPILKNRTLSNTIPATTLTVITAPNTAQDFGDLFNSAGAMNWLRLSDPTCCSSLSGCENYPDSLGVSYLVDVGQVGAVPMNPSCDWNWDSQQVFMCLVPQAVSTVKAGGATVTTFTRPTSYWTATQACELAGSMLAIADTKSRTSLPSPAGNDVPSGTYWVDLGSAGASNNCMVANLANGKLDAATAAAACTGPHPFVCVNEPPAPSPLPPSPVPSSPIPSPIPSPLPSPPPASPSPAPSPILAQDTLQSSPAPSPAPSPVPSPVIVDLPASPLPSPIVEQPVPVTPPADATPALTPDQTWQPGTDPTYPVPVNDGGTGSYVGSGDTTQTVSSTDGSTSGTSGGSTGDAAAAPSGKSGGWKVGVGLAFMFVALAAIAAAAYIYRRKLQNDIPVLKGFFPPGKGSKGYVCKDPDCDGPPKGSKGGKGGRDCVQNFNPMYGLPRNNSSTGGDPPPAVAIVSSRHGSECKATLVSPRALGASMGGPPPRGSPLGASQAVDAENPEAPPAAGFGAGYMQALYPSNRGRVRMVQATRTGGSSELNAPPPAVTSRPASNGSSMAGTISSSGTGLAAVHNVVQGQGYVLHEEVVGKPAGGSPAALLGSAGRQRMATASPAARPSPSKASLHGGDVSDEETPSRASMPVPRAPLSSGSRGPAGPTVWVAGNRAGADTGNAAGRRLAF